MMLEIPDCTSWTWLRHECLVQKLTDRCGSISIPIFSKISLLAMSKMKEDDALYVRVVLRHALDMGTAMALGAPSR